jgi:hypothetical protein
MRRSTLIVLALLAALQAALLVRDRARPSHEELAERERRVLPGLERDQIRGLLLERRDEPVELAREGGVWRVVRPIRARADAGAVEAILSALEFLELRRTVPEGVSLRQLGLDPPALRLRLRGAGDAELRLGSLDPTRQGLYLQAGGRVGVVEAPFLEVVDRELDALRDRALGALRADELDLVEIRSEHGDLALTRAADRRGFQVAAGGVRTRADATRALQITAALAALSATRFPREASVARPTLSLRARSRRGATLGLELLGPCPARPRDRLLRATGVEPAPVLACVDASDLAPVLSAAAATGLAELRDLRLTDLEEPALRAIRIEAGRASLALVRDGARWRLADGNGIEADDGALRAWLGSLRDTATRLEPTDPGRLAALGLGASRIVLEREAGGRETIELGQGSAALPARSGGMEGAVLRVAPEARALFAVDPLRFRSRRVVALQRHEVAAIGVERGGAREELLRRPEGGFACATRAVDQDRALALLDRLARLEALRFATAAEKLAAPTLTLRLRLDPDAGAHAPRELRLELGPELAGGGCLGRVAEERKPEVPLFVLAATDCAVLRAPLTSTR